MPAYEQVRSRILTSGHKLFPVPGNHDTEFDSLGVPREWTQVTADGLVTMIGLDNSSGYLTDTGKAFFSQPKATPFEFTFAHMPPCVTILPDGTENTHGMIESGPNPDADWLMSQLQQRADAMFCGHYHGWTYQTAKSGTPLIVDGRGGAAPDLGYTLITVTPDGWVLHSVGLS